MLCCYLFIYFKDKSYCCFGVFCYNVRCRIGCSASILLLGPSRAWSTILTRGEVMLALLRCVYSLFFWSGTVLPVTAFPAHYPSSSTHFVEWETTVVGSKEEMGEGGLLALLLQCLCLHGQKVVRAGLKNKKCIYKVGFKLRNDSWVIESRPILLQATTLYKAAKPSQDLKLSHPYSCLPIAAQSTKCALKPPVMYSYLIKFPTNVMATTVFLNPEDQEESGWPPCIEGVGCKNIPWDLVDLGSVPSLCQRRFLWQCPNQWVML